MFRITKETAGLCVALVFSTAFLLRGTLAITRGEYVSTTRLGTVIDLSGGPALAVGVGYFCAGMSVLAVALAQWPRIRTISTAVAIVSAAAALVGFGRALVS